MALFSMPRAKWHEVKITDELKELSDSGFMTESQIKKFSEFPDLLEEEIENENAHPDISVFEKDIFDAVYMNDYVKFFRCVARVGVRGDLLARIYNWLIAKEDFNPKKDMQLLRRIEGAKSVFNIFEY